MLAGVFCYAIFSWQAVRKRKVLRQVLIGLMFGLLAMFYSLNTFVLGELKAPIDAKAGAMLFAGYLGGPLGGAVTLAIGCLTRVMIPAPLPAILTGFFIYSGFVFSGVLIRLFMPPREWPEVSGRVVLAMLPCFVVAQYLPVYILHVTNPGLVPTETVVFDVLFFFVLGVLSILMTWCTVSLAHRMARQSDETLQLASRLELALKAANVGVVMGSMVEETVTFDAEALRIFGFESKTPGPVRLSDALAAVHADDIAFVQEKMGRIEAGTELEREFEFRLIRPESEEARYIRVSWSGQPDHDTGRVWLTAMLTDLTESRKKERAHIDALEHIARVANAFPGVIFQSIHEKDGTFSFNYISKKCFDYWGLRPQELYDDPTRFGENELPEDVETVRSTVLKSAQSGEPAYVRVRAHHTDGTVRWVDFHANTTPLSDGRVQMNVVTVDATAEVEALADALHQSEVANRAQRMESIGRLTGGVAHDFNNLLAVIMGNLELLKDETGDAEHLKMIDAGLEATRRGADLTRGMLAFARRARLEPVTLDLNDVIRQSRLWMNRALPETVDVETSLLAGLWRVRLDLASLESAVLNLLLNARDAMDSHGKLTIETANVRVDEAYVDSRDQELEPGRYVMLAISDTGTGIPEDTLRQVFEPFFSTKGPGKGSGMGLSMVQGFVKQSGGTVQIYTEIGVGTTFKLYFPATNAPAPAKTEVEELQDQRGAGRRILLAEDEAAVREMLVSTLRKAGYHVTSAASGDEARSIYEANPTFDLLITDIVMPGTLQGTDLARELRAMAPELPMIFLSGYASEATVHGNGLRPEDIRLMKPVPRGDLLSAVASTLPDDE